VRYFFSTGEPSGELLAVALAGEIRALDPEATFEGIGSTRMREAGFALWRDNQGWASIGPIAAIPRIPKLLHAMYRTAAQLAKRPPDLVVLVDFGAFNLRLAKTLRARRYAGPILDALPPSAWTDNEKAARAVAAVAVPLTAFRRQQAFYRRLGLPVAYFGHPLAPGYAARARRPAPPPDGGTVALLPGSRTGEITRLLPRLLEAYRLLRATRPALRAVVAAADDASERTIRALARRAGMRELPVVRGSAAATADADAAWIASGTAVLEAVLSGVPTIALYALAPVLLPLAKRLMRSPWITLPNLVLDDAVIPELLQDAATPAMLAYVMDQTLRDPSYQYDAFERLRAELGPDDALRSWAAFAVSLALAGKAG
jgi:lipid-A-disaccharide synthase